MFFPISRTKTKQNQSFASTTGSLGNTSINRCSWNLNGNIPSNCLKTCPGLPFLGHRHLTVKNRDQNGHGGFYRYRGSDLESGKCHSKEGSFWEEINLDGIQMFWLMNSNSLTCACLLLGEIKQAENILNKVVSEFNQALLMSSYTE